MSKIFPVFLILVGFLLNASVLSRLNIGAMFDIGLVLIICFGLTKGEIKGAVFGFFFGLVNGMLMANMLGFFALLGFAAGFASGVFREDCGERSLIATVLIVLGVVFSYQIVSYIGQAVIVSQFGFLQRLHTIVLPKTILTTILFVPIYLCVDFVRSKVKRVELV